MCVGLHMCVSGIKSVSSAAGRADCPSQDDDCPDGGESKVLAGHREKGFNVAQSLLLLIC